MSDVELTGLAKRYGEALAVDDLTLHIPQGEFFSLLGPSGCGKSTTLRMIAGFVRPSAGRIALGGEDVTDLPPEKRNIGIVFQNYAIFPHLNIFENIAFGLRMRKVEEREITRRVHEALEQVGLAGYDKRYQKEISGGQQQRVALARVLVTRPRILLLDEPLSALDRKLREEMKIWIKDLQRELSITTIYVTHDQGEALTMSDRIGVMDNARIVQVGSPTEIYERPANLFVTTFIGESNILDVTVNRIDGDWAWIVADGEEMQARAGTDTRAGDDAKLVLRPESIILGEAASAACDRTVTVTVVDRIYEGALLRYRLKWGEQILYCETQNQSQNQLYEPGRTVELGWPADRASIIGK